MVGPTFAIARETPGGSSWSPRLEGFNAFDLGGNTKRPLFVKGSQSFVGAGLGGLKLLKGFLWLWVVWCLTQAPFQRDLVSLPPKGFEAQRGWVKKTVKPATLNLNCKSFVANFEVNFDGILKSFFHGSRVHVIFFLRDSLFDNTSLKETNNTCRVMIPSGTFFSVCSQEFYILNFPCLCLAKRRWMCIISLWAEWDPPMVSISRCSRLYSLLVVGGPIKCPRISCFIMHAAFNF